jgi:hypothetical protein
MTLDVNSVMGKNIRARRQGQNVGDDDNIGDVISDRPPQAGEAALSEIEHLRFLLARAISSSG